MLIMPTELSFSLFCVFIADDANHDWLNVLLIKYCLSRCFPPPFHIHTLSFLARPPPLHSGPTSKLLGNSKLSQRHLIELVFLLRFDLSLDSLRLIFLFSVNFVFYDPNSFSMMKIKKYLTKSS